MRRVSGALVGLGFRRRPLPFDAAYDGTRSKHNAYRQ